MFDFTAMLDLQTVFLFAVEYINLGHPKDYIYLCQRKVACYLKTLLGPDIAKFVLPVEKDNGLEATAQCLLLSMGVGVGGESGL